ncbi:MAG: Uma2 family endonuclease [Planctomycetes bacterium]|nr:Uma2 family endonuclease [Planctomycetota bacterium]
MKNGTTLLDPVPVDGKPILDLDALEPGVPFRLTNVSWADYERLLQTIGNLQYRTTYDDGEFEITMPISSTHGAWVWIVSRLILALAEELDLHIKGLDPFTIRREDVQKGIEPDRWYYFENEPLVRGKLELDFNIDPPPDLALEADLTSTVEKRFRIYAALRVPEIWRYKDDALSWNNWRTTANTSPSNAAVPSRKYHSANWSDSCICTVKRTSGT